MLVAVVSCKWCKNSLQSNVTLARNLYRKRKLAHHSAVGLLCEISMKLSHQNDAKLSSCDYALATAATR